MDKALVEDADEGEEKRIMQAPNRAERWSTHQKPREQAMVGPRFEQTIIDAQVCLGSCRCGVMKLEGRGAD